MVTRRQASESAPRLRLSTRCEIKQAPGWEVRGDLGRNDEVARPVDPSKAARDLGMLSHAPAEQTQVPPRPAGERTKRPEPMNVRRKESDNHAPFRTVNHLFERIQDRSFPTRGSRVEHVGAVREQKLHALVSGAREAGLVVGCPSRGSASSLKSPL